MKQGPRGQLLKFLQQLHHRRRLDERARREDDVGRTAEEPRLVMSLERLAEGEGELPEDALEWASY